MKKLKNFLGLTGLMFCTAFLMESCDMNPGFVEKQASAEADVTTNALIGPGLSYPISMNKVDLFTHASTTLTGTVTVQITSGDGSVVIGSTTVPGSSILKGNVKNTFYFPNMTLSSGQKYRINVKRSTPHNHVNDYIYWRSSSFNVDAYTKGVTNFHPTVTDFAFTTYSDGYTDQKQSLNNYGFAVNNSYFFWQEFVPSKIWVIGQ
jgi:hypothetical protein